MERRFGESARIDYLDITNPVIRESHGKLIEEVEARGLLYPVTVVDGVPAYDGAVSYPAILRAVQNKLTADQPQN